MTLRECGFCQNDYELRRKGHKYCSTNCRTKAYLERKALALSKNITGDYDRNNEISYSQIRPSNNFIGNQLDEQKIASIIKSAVQSNSKPVGGHDPVLLAEKDYTRDLSSQLSEYRMKLFYLEEKLKDRDKEIAELKSSFDKLNTEVKLQDSGFVERLLETNPTLIPMCLEKLSPLLNKNQVDTNVNSIGKIELTKAESLNDDSDEAVSEAKKSISEQLQVLGNLYPDYRIDDIVKIIVEKIKTNKPMIDSMMGIK